MIHLLRTNSEHIDFIELVKLLDTELAVRDGDSHSFYSQFNKIDKIKHVVVAYENEIPIACGAIKEYNSETMELKRMYTLPAQRGKGMAGRILKELENWAVEMNFHSCILETGINQPEAIALYKKNAYLLIPNYDQYIDAIESLCFKKELKKLSNESD